MSPVKRSHPLGPPPARPTWVSGNSSAPQTAIDAPETTQLTAFGGLIAEAVRTHATAPALIAGLERTAVSYAELAALALHLRAFLEVNGLVPGDVVALEAANSVEFIGGLLGAGEAGLVVAPLNPALAPAERTTRLDRLGARVVLSDARVDIASGDCPTWKLAFTPGRADLQVTTIGKPRVTPPGAPDVTPDDRLIMFTAGTTGPPKMVPWTQQNITAVVGDICRGDELSAADSSVATVPFFHGHGLIAALFSPLASAGRVLLPASGRFAAHTFWDDLDHAKATWFTAVPTILEILLTRASTERPAGQQVRLRFVRTCSAPLNPTTAAAFQRLVGAPVIDAYGMTETTHQAASQPLPTDAEGKAHTVGRPTGTEVRIVAADGDDCAPGTAGEIWVRGPTVVRGYLEDADDTAGSFTNGWFHTGDLGTLDDDGYLAVTGRIKTLINRGGEKVAPEHVEEILNQDPTVAESAVLGPPDPILGERVVALLVPAPGQVVDPDRVIANCRPRLAPYEVPQDLRVVNAIPHTAKGSIDRVAALVAYEQYAT